MDFIEDKLPIDEVSDEAFAISPPIELIITEEELANQITRHLNTWEEIAESILDVEYGRPIRGAEIDMILVLEDMCAMNSALTDMQAAQIQETMRTRAQNFTTYYSDVLKAANILLKTLSEKTGTQIATSGAIYSKFHEIAKNKADSMRIKSEENKRNRVKRTLQ